MTTATARSETIEVQQRVDRVAPRDHHHRGGTATMELSGENCIHGSRLLTSTGGRSFSASPLPLPLISSPDTR